MDGPTFKPNINQCGINLTDYDTAKDMIMYEYSMDATMSDTAQDLWINQNGFNIIKIVFDIDFDFEEKKSFMPLKPDYVSDIELGAVEGSVHAQLIKLKTDSSMFCFLLNYINFNLTQGH